MVKQTCLISQDFQNVSYIDLSITTRCWPLVILLCNSKVDVTSCSCYFWFPSVASQTVIMVIQIIVVLAVDKEAKQEEMI